MVDFSPEELEYILNQPAQESPDGVYQFDNPPNSNAKGVIPASICIAIGTLAALLRLYAKIAYLGIFINFILLSENPGLWVHTWDIRIKDLEPYIKLTYALVTCYSCCMILMKAAVLLEWNHIFVPTGGRNWFFWTSYTVMFMNAGLYIAGIVATWKTCTPMEKEYRPWVDGTCIDRKKMDETIIVFNLVFDILILLLPQKVIWGLQTRNKNKVGIALVFSVGLIACACAAGRVHATFTLNYDDDATYYSPIAELWAIAEGTCVLLIFCIPNAPRVFKTDDHLITKIAHSVRSWSRLPWASRSGSQSSLPRSVRKPSQEGSQGDGQGAADSIPLTDYDGSHTNVNGHFNPAEQTTFGALPSHPESHTAANPYHPWDQNAPRQT
ncbi:hypothetical protein PFICI_10146 [Pestalotiopsis fici W106-1]|uniref:Rhodopsin domain-containing protein n=1 Tax=Pestalotiopsis fici (strain W106-1 / CGMCC3.15140) TaxID=1229662 RepID=W3WW99_PESFW|nr:uncharacterized protein PFICI_10146 [Pestalotiopsis fici W106-1]ETS78084.1 hypothetical protein PFICI_10146 [Pestalotiopsis fici W106-1]